MRVQLAVVILSLALSSVWSANVQQLVQQNARQLTGIQAALNAVANKAADIQTRQSDLDAKVDSVVEKTDDIDAEVDAVVERTADIQSAQSDLGTQVENVVERTADIQAVQSDVDAEVGTVVERTADIQAAQSDMNAKVDTVVDRTADIANAATVIEAAQAQTDAKVDTVVARTGDIQAEHGAIQNSQARIESGIASLRQMLNQPAQPTQPNQPTTHQPNQDSCAGISYTVLEDAWRNVNNTMQDSLHCDQTTLPAGWYRFRLNGANAVIPTSCIEELHCGTHAPIWLDLQGQALPGVGQEIQATPCAHWSGTCCFWPQPTAAVRNCGSFYIYKLQPALFCNLAYCAAPL